MICSAQCAALLTHRALLCPPLLCSALLAAAQVYINRCDCSLATADSNFYGMMAGQVVGLKYIGKVRVESLQVDAEGKVTNILVTALPPSDPVRPKSTIQWVPFENSVPVTVRPRRGEARQQANCCVVLCIGCTCCAVLCTVMCCAVLCVYNIRQSDDSPPSLTLHHPLCPPLCSPRSTSTATSSRRKSPRTHSGRRTSTP